MKHKPKVVAATGHYKALAARIAFVLDDPVLRDDGRGYNEAGYSVPCDGNADEFGDRMQQGEQPVRVRD